MTRAREPRDRRLRARPRDASAARSLERVCALFPAVRDKLDAPAGVAVGRPAADGRDRPRADGAAASAAARRAVARPVADRSCKAMFGAIREVNAAGTAVLLVEQNVAMALDIAASRVPARGRPDRGRGHARRGVRQPGAAPRLPWRSAGALTCILHPQEQSNAQAHARRHRRQQPSRIDQPAPRQGVDEARRGSLRLAVDPHRRPADVQPGPRRCAARRRQSLHRRGRGRSRAAVRNPGAQPVDPGRAEERDRLGLEAHRQARSGAGTSRRSPARRSASSAPRSASSTCGRSSAFSA